MERCPLCPKECKTRQALVSHIRSQHPEFYSLENGYPGRQSAQSNSATDEKLEELLALLRCQEERIEAIDLMISGLLDREEEGAEEEASEESQPGEVPRSVQVVEPPKTFLATDDEMRKEFPLLYGDES